MPMTMLNPVVVPAKAEVVCDKMEVAKMVVEKYSTPDGDKWAATAVLNFYAQEEENGAKEYARDELGKKLEATVSTNDCFGKAVTTPEVGEALAGIQAACVALYNELNETSSGSSVSSEESASE